MDIAPFIEGGAVVVLTAFAWNQHKSFMKHIDNHEEHMRKSIENNTTVTKDLIYYLKNHHGKCKRGRK